MAAVDGESTTTRQASQRNAADRYLERTIRRSIVVVSVTCIAALASSNSVSGSGKDSQKERPSQWGSMMRREPNAVAGIEVAAGSHTEAPTADKTDRPEHWGAVMRREPKQAVGTPAPAEGSAEGTSTIKAARPEHWGGMMRREATIAVAGDGLPHGGEDTSSAPHKDRPAHWGGMMRREGEVAPVSKEPSAVASLVSACKGWLADWFAGSGKGRVLFFVIASIGFGLQVKDLFFSAIRASKHCEAGIGKEK